MFTANGDGRARRWDGVAYRVTPAEGGPAAKTCRACAAAGMEELLPEVGGGTGPAKTSKAGATLAMIPPDGKQRFVVFPLVVCLLIFVPAGIDAASSARWEGRSSCSIGIAGGDSCAGIDAASFGETQQLSQLEGQLVVDHVDGCLLENIVVGLEILHLLVVGRVASRCRFVFTFLAIMIIALVLLCYPDLGHHLCIFLDGTDGSEVGRSVDDDLTERDRRRRHAAVHDTRVKWQSGEIIRMGNSNPHRPKR